jgi:hypothetical protein
MVRQTHHDNLLGVILPKDDEYCEDNRFLSHPRKSAAKLSVAHIPVNTILPVFLLSAI